MSVDFNSISGIDLIWDRINESRKKQTISFLVSIVGGIFFSGGLLETITSNGNISWLLFIPFKSELTNQNFVSLSMIISGFTFLIIGTFSCIYYQSYRQYYFQILNRGDARQNIHFSHGKIKAFNKELAKTQEELGACKIYIMNRYDQNEIDSLYYCKLLGKHWVELVEEENLFSNINA